MSRPNIRLLIPIVAVIGVGIWGFQRWSYGRSHESTDNAQIDGHIVPVVAKVGGYVTAIDAVDNGHVDGKHVLVKLDTRELQVKLAQAEGIDAKGPISADTVFHRAYNGAFDLVIAQYHDQGHIPIKLVAFDDAVNVSVELPIDRTSVDHGTAFDIAGQGIANHGNMNAAIAYARKLVAGGKK